MKEIKEYIKLYMSNDPLWKINEYIYSFLQDGEITESQCESLIAWAKDFHNCQ